jgi:ataxia telangiectasia mutated family protein
MLVSSSTYTFAMFFAQFEVVDAMGITGVEGTFRTACEETLRVLRREEYIILTILDVFRFDPLYRWSSSVLQKRKRQDETSGGETVAKTTTAFTTGNKEAARALLGYFLFYVAYQTKMLIKSIRVQKKLLSNVSVECQVNDLIQTAMDPKNLARMFPGWQAWL